MIPSEQVELRTQVLKELERVIEAGHGEVIIKVADHSIVWFSAQAQYQLVKKLNTG